MMNPENLISYKFGAIIRIALATERRNLDLYSIAAQIMPAIRLDQVCILENSRRAPRGYAAWAYLSGEVLAALDRNPDTLLHASDWNEGEHLFIADCVAPHGDLAELLDLLARCAIRNHRTVYAMSRQPSGRRLLRIGIPRRWVDAAADV